MATVLDVGPLLTLKTRLRRAALGSAATVYIEGLLVLVTVTDGTVTPAVVLLAAPMIVAQALVLRHPAQQLLDRRLSSSFKRHLVLAVLLVLTLAAGADGGDGRIACLILGALAVAPSWPVATAIRRARGLRSHLQHLPDRRVLLSCLAFEPQMAMTVRWRALGGRARWTRPFAAGAVALAGTLVILALLFQALGLRPPGAIGSVAAAAALWVFYRTVRHVKPRASELRAYDARRPVLVLRQFADDTLSAGRLPGATFEHAIVTDLSRVGPTISIGRPGERLQPLGAAREYLGPADWRTAVEALLGDTRLVVFILGGSESLTWEFKTAVRTCGPNRVLIVVPPTPRGEIEARWRSFSTTAADALTEPLPPTLPDARVLAVMFAGGETIFLVNGTRTGKRWGSRRGWPEHRVVLRLRECVGDDPLVSVGALRHFLERTLPLLEMHALPMPQSNARSGAKDSILRSVLNVKNRTAR